MVDYDALDSRTYRLIVMLIVGYFVLFVYAATTGEPLAWTATDVLFGVIAFGIGWLLYSQRTDRVGPVAVGGICFLLGGVSQFAYLASRMAVFDVLTTVLVVVGIVFYGYAIWNES